MSSIPPRITRRPRPKAAPRPPAIVDSPDPTPAAVPAVDAPAPLRAVEDPTPVAVQLATVGGSPTAGDVLPVEPGGHDCPRCGVYVTSPARHANWHRENDENADRWNFIRSIVLRVFQAWGYITKDGKATATDGNSEGNSHA
jgi:hypothetical protein